MLDYPLDHHSRTFLRIGPKFVELVNNDVLTNKEHHLRNFDIDSEEGEVVDPNIRVEAYDPDVDDNMNDFGSGSVTPPYYLVIPVTTEDNAIF